MTNIKKRIVSMILALCMVFTMVPSVPARAAEPRYYTVEKYDSEGNGTMLVKPSVTDNWQNAYGEGFVKSILGSDNVKMSNDAVIAIRDDSQEDGWLDNGDLEDGSYWVVSADSECCVDTAYGFYPSRVSVIRFIYVPGGDFSKAGLTTDGEDGWSIVGTVKVNKDELIKGLTDYDPDNLGGNRLKAYNAAIDMILNTTDATADSVAAALENMRNASDSATGITVPEENVNLTVGQRYEIKPTLDPLGSTDRLTWETSDEKVATVVDGVVTATGAGTATITVTADDPNVKASVYITVTPINSIKITSMGTNTLEAQSGTKLLTAVIDPANTVNHVEWSVSDPEVAVVTPQESNEIYASVSGLKEGTATITAKVGELEATYDIVVTAYTGPYVYFEYADGRTQELDENDTITLTCLDEGKFVVGRPKGTTTWSGGNAYVTSIQGGDDLSYHVFIGSETGVWNPWDVRSLNVTANSGGWSKAFTVNCVASGITELKNYVNGTEVTLDDPYVTEGKISGVGVATKGKNADGEWIDIPTQALHYSTSDTTYNFRWVGNQMIINSGGQATMSVFMKDDWNVKAQFLAKCTYVPLEGFTIETPETFTITGEKDFMTGYYYGLQLYTDNLKVTYTPSNATNTELIWESLTPDIAFFTTQHNSGIVPLKCGTARFKVTSQDNSSLTQDVIVKFLYLHPLESAELAQTEYEMKVGDTQALEITVTPSNATEKGFSYSYDREGIVEVKDGTIIAKSAGEVTVTGTPLDDTMGCNTITFTVKVTGEAVEQDDPTAIVADGIAHGLSYLENQSVSEYGNEWTIFTILRAGGSISDENKAAYLDSVEAKLTTDATENKLQPTDYVRMVLTLGVMGEDPEDFRGFNLVEKLYTWKNLDYMTSNQISWTLLALDSRDYDIPEGAVNSRDQLIEWLLLFQMDDGGFALTDSSDVDMTGMIMQALAPYNNDDHPEVQAAFTKALAWLQTQINVNAGFAENASYNENSCTTAQVLTALAVAGIDPLDPSNGLTVGKKNVITNLYSYKALDGFYWDPTQETKGNAMATQQVTYALEAYRRFAAKENSLYDLTDVNPKKEDGPVVAGTITVAVERFSIGQGYLIEPYTTEFYEGETYADVCVRILEDHNFNPTTKGSSFYLSGIDGADEGTISVPDCIALLGQKKIGVNYVDPPTNDAVNEYAGDTKWLGEFSYSRMSGWMYSVGNDDGWEFPGVGMDGRTPKDGDVYRLQFTLWGYGEDLTGVNYADESTVYYEVGDKTDLTREIALINKDKETWFAGAVGRQDAYNNAMEVLQKLDATQKELDTALDLLKNPVDQEAEAKAAFESGKPAITLKATAYNQVKVTWNSYADATGYRVYRKTAGAQWELLTETTGLSYTDKTVSGETTYYYTVKAVSTKWGGKVYSQYDKTKKVKTPVDPAKTAFQKGKPAVTVKAAAYNQVKVTWKKYTNATSYRVYRKISGGSWKLLKETTGLSYTDKTAVTGTTYYYTVKAVSTKWGGKTNSLYVTNVKVKTALSTPAISSVKNSKSKQAVVSWNKVSGASGYVVYRATSKNGTYKKVATVKSGSTVKYTNTGLKKGSTYYYKVRAYRTVSGKNVYSSYSAAKSVKITK